MADPIKNRPRRARIWRGVLIIAGLFALVVGGMAWAAWPYLMAEPAAPDSTALSRVNDLVAGGQPEGDNGWEVLRRFFREECELVDGRARGNERWLALNDHRTDLHELLGNDWDDPRLDQHKAALQASMWALPALDAAMAAPRFIMPLRFDGDLLTDAPDKPSGMVSPLRGGMSPIRKVQQVNLAAMRAAAARGDFEEAARRFDTGLRLGERHTRQRLMFDVLLGASAQGLTLQELAKELNEHDWPTQVCEQLEASIRDQAVPADRIEGVVDADALLLWTLVQPMFSDDGVFLMWKYDRLRGDLEGIFSGGSGKLYDSPPSIAERIGNLRSFAAPSRNELLRSWEEAKVEARKAMRGEPFRDVTDVYDIGLSLDEDARGFILIDPKGYSALGRLTMRVRADAAAAIVMLRLETFHAREGRWPVSLEEAMPTADAIDPASGLPFEYRVVTGEARPYALRFPAAARYIRASDKKDGYDPWDVNAVRPWRKLYAEYERDGTWERPENDPPQ